jgi:thiol-disulfide isomerase/thioredoxin
MKTAPALLFWGMVQLCTFARAAPSAVLEPLSDLAQVSRAAHPQAQIRLVHFWALWCPPCVAEFPRALALAKEAKAHGVDVLFINADGFAQSEKVRAYLLRLNALGVARHVQLNLDLDPRKVSALFDAHWESVLPATFVLQPGRGTIGAVRGALGPKAADHLRRLLWGIPR